MYLKQNWHAQPRKSHSTTNRVEIVHSMIHESLILSRCTQAIRNIRSAIQSYAHVFSTKEIRNIRSANQSCTRCSNARKLNFEYSTKP